MITPTHRCWICLQTQRAIISLLWGNIGVLPSPRPGWKMTFSASWHVTLLKIQMNLGHSKKILTPRLKRRKKIGVYQWGAERSWVNDNNINNNNNNSDDKGKIGALYLCMYDVCRNIACTSKSVTQQNFRSGLEIEIELNLCTNLSN